MVRRYKPSQFRSKVRQTRQKAQTQQRQAIQKAQAQKRQFVQKVRQAEQKAQTQQRLAVQTSQRQIRQSVQRAIDQRNRDIHAYTRQVQANQRRIRNALVHLRQVSATARTSAVYSSSQSLNDAYGRLEDQARTAALGANYEELVGYAEHENANSLELANALLGGSTEAEFTEDNLAETAITSELTLIDPDLDSRWTGALFVLNPDNPDAARHFCTSSREIITMILHSKASDAEVLKQIPGCETDQNGRPTRRSRIHYYLKGKGIAIDPLEELVEEDIDAVIELFEVLNKGTHSSAGRYDLTQLGLIKQRVEDTILFLFKIVD